LFIYAAWPGHSTYTISPETTYVTEPLDAEGYVDYPTALNERLSKGISPENNANVLIWQALGPRPEGKLMSHEYFEWLRIDQPPEEGEYLIPWQKYFNANLKTPPADFGGATPDGEGKWGVHWWDRVERAQKWPWKANDEPEIADWLKQNKRPLAVAIQASKRPQYYNPLVPRFRDPRHPRIFSSVIPNVERCRDVAKALRCRAMAKVAEGDFGGAWQDLMACQRLGRLLSHGGSISEWLVSTAVLTIATEGMLTVLSHCKFSSGRLAEWLNQLKALPPIQSLATAFDLGERFMVLDTYQAVVGGGIMQLKAAPGSWGEDPSVDSIWDRFFTRSVDYDPAFRNANIFFDRCVAATRLPTRNLRNDAFEQILTEKRDAKVAFLEMSFVERKCAGNGRRGELIGHLLLAMMVPSVDKYQNAMERATQNQLNLQVAVALAAYRADDGRYPARLDDLAPKYLPKVPDDIFSGKPLIYKLADDGYLLYSVGVNGLDEEGRWTDDDPPGDDLRVRMPVPEPKP
jgi:hypothetical protein